MQTLSRRQMLAAAGSAAASMIAMPRWAAAADEAKGFVLPPLPYATNALEKAIDEKTMEIHHDKHHAAYVANLNKAVGSSEWAKMPIEELIRNLDKVPKSIQTAVRNNGGGHYNHTLFWEIMGPQGGKPEGDLAKAIDSAFGSYDGLVAKLSDAAVKQFGSGWAWLIVKGGQLAVVSSPNQDNPLMPFAEEKGVPILGIDVWEHAYYLRYQNLRPKYVEAWFSVINWENVASRFKKAMA
jgi:Fe-Mn family superoxide dismutase